MNISVSNATFAIPKVVLPLAPATKSGAMQRIAIVCDVQMIAQKIGAWGAGQNRDTLLKSIWFYADGFRCATPQRSLAVQDYFADFFDGDLTLDVNDMAADTRQTKFTEISKTAKADERTYRAQYAGAAQ